MCSLIVPLQVECPTAANNTQRLQTTSRVALLVPLLIQHFHTRCALCFFCTHAFDVRYLEGYIVRHCAEDEDEGGKVEQYVAPFRLIRRILPLAHV